MNKNLIRGALANTGKGSGASDEYAQGVVIGVVTALMATMPFRFDEAIEYIRCRLPDSYRIEAIPESWRDLFDG